MKRDDSERELRELHTKTDREMEKAKQVCSHQPTNSFKSVRLIRPPSDCLNTPFLRMLIFSKDLPLAFSSILTIFQQPINFSFLLGFFFL